METIYQLALLAVVSLFPLTFATLVFLLFEQRTELGGVFKDFPKGSLGSPKLSLVPYIIWVISMGVLADSFWKIGGSYTGWVSGVVWTIGLLVFIVNMLFGYVGHVAHQNTDSKA